MLIQTGSQTVGPFFHNGLIFGGENILVNAETKGERIIIEGTVYDGDGVPVPDAMIEIWQPDAQGLFNHSADPNRLKADPAFAGFGRAETVNKGRFYFKTVKPGPIAEVAGSIDAQKRAPYINVRVFARGMLIHAVTRIYFSDEEANTDDPLLVSLETTRRQTLIAQRIEGDDLPCYRFDIHLQGTNETAFFDL